MSIRGFQNKHDTLFSITSYVSMFIICAYTITWQCIMQSKTCGHHFSDLVEECGQLCKCTGDFGIDLSMWLCDHANVLPRLTNNIWFSQCHLTGIQTRNITTPRCILCRKTYSIYHCENNRNYVYFTLHYITALIAEGSIEKTKYLLKHI